MVEHFHNGNLTPEEIQIVFEMMFRDNLDGIGLGRIINWMTFMDLAIRATPDNLCKFVALLKWGRWSKDPTRLLFRSRLLRFGLLLWPGSESSFREHFKFLDLINVPLGCENDVFIDK